MRRRTKCRSTVRRRLASPFTSASRTRTVKSGPAHYMRAGSSALIPRPTAGPSMSCPSRYFMTAGPGSIIPPIRSPFGTWITTGSWFASSRSNSVASLLQYYAKVDGGTPSDRGPEKPNENLPGRNDDRVADCARLRSDDVEGGQASRVRAEDRTEGRPEAAKGRRGRL